jgi:hypothetical protein
LQPDVNKFTVSEAQTPCRFDDEGRRGSSVVKTSATRITAHSANRNGLVHFAERKVCKTMPDKRDECQDLRINVVKRCVKLLNAAV